MTRRAALIVASLTLAGCAVFNAGTVPTGEVSRPYPEGCAHFDLSARRCKAILDWAVAQSHAASAVTSVEMLGDPGCGAGIDPNVLCKRSTSFVARMRLHFDNGGSVDESVFCGVGGQYSLLCTETPEIQIGGVTMLGSGYRDVPCDNDTGKGCGLPLPSADAAALAAARPLRVPTLDIPIDHVGHYAVEVGHAIVPNGVISTTTAVLVNPMTQTVSVTEAGINVDVRPVDPGAPLFDNYYTRGWHPGPEEVVLTLRFDVREFTPGAVLQLRDLVVE
jgi:hypothetical protein